MKVGFTTQALETMAASVGADLSTDEYIPGDAGKWCGLYVAAKTAAAAGEAVLKLEPGEDALPDFAGATLPIFHDWQGSGKPVIMTEEEAATFESTSQHPGIVRIDI